MMIFVNICMYLVSAWFDSEIVVMKIFSKPVKLVEINIVYVSTNVQGCCGETITK